MLNRFKKESNIKNNFKKENKKCYKECMELLNKKEHQQKRNTKNNYIYKGAVNNKKHMKENKNVNLNLKLLNSKNINKCWILRKNRLKENINNIQHIKWNNKPR